MVWEPWPEPADVPPREDYCGAEIRERSRSVTTNHCSALLLTL
jgi:hypothetical protein